MSFDGSPFRCCLSRVNRVICRTNYYESLVLFEGFMSKGDLLHSIIKFQTCFLLLLSMIQSVNWRVQSLWLLPAYQGTAGLNISAVKNCENCTLNYTFTAPYHLSPIQLCEQKLRLSCYLYLPPQITANKQWILWTHMIKYASEVTKLMFPQVLNVWLQGIHMCFQYNWIFATWGTKFEDLKIVSTRNL
jgi:hypothetical protein